MSFRRAVDAAILPVNDVVTKRQCDREGQMTRTVWFTALFGLAAWLAAAAPAVADPIIVSTTPAADGAAMFIADAEGYYAKHGIDAKPTLTGLMPNLPPALVANSAQIGCITTTTFVQAVDGGLDLVAIAGGSVISHQLNNTALVAGADSNIHAAQDLVGRKVGVPGIGAYFHVIVSYWLLAKGVDPKQVNFVEVPFPAMRDTLASKKVDAVGAVDPVLSLIVNAKIGYVAAPIIQDLPEGKSILVYAATREWAEAHRKDVAAFHAAIADADAFIAANPQKALEDLNKYLKMPPPVAAFAKIGIQDPNLTPEQINWWVGVMQKQGLLKGSPDMAKAIFQ
jgi:NitT/TauT family transport system substrate-binding protein